MCYVKQKFSKGCQNDLGSLYKNEIVKHLIQNACKCDGGRTTFPSRHRMKKALQVSQKKVKIIRLGYKTRLLFFAATKNLQPQHGKCWELEFTNLRYLIRFETSQSVCF